MGRLNLYLSAQLSRKLRIPVELFMQFAQLQLEGRRLCCYVHFLNAINIYH